MSDLTPRAKQVLALARKEADRFNHSYVGTEHLLLGLIKLGQGVAVNVLEGWGSIWIGFAWRWRGLSVRIPKRI
jgi:ATP-dependent Clp protease ATP-binding subunit ClpC